MNNKNIPTLNVEKKGDEHQQDWLLLGSIIGNILQAFQQASTANKLNIAKQVLKKVEADHDFLVQRLKEWQNAYNFLKNKIGTLEKEILNTEKELSNHREELYKVKKEQELKNEEIERLKGENVKLKLENEKLKTKEVKK